MSGPRFDAGAFATLVRDLCQLRRGPEDVPYSTTLLGVLIAVSTAVDLMTGVVIGESSNMLACSLVSTGVVLALCWIALAARRLVNRMVQTSSALIACGIVFSLLIVPISWLAMPLPVPPASLTPLQMLLGWVTLAILAWSLVVTAHIMRRALDAPFAFGFLLALAWWLAARSLDHVLFDPAG